jgi:twinfilin-like protein
MSHSANVNISKETEEAIVNFKTDTSLRAIKLVMDEENLICEKKIPVEGSYEQDFDLLVDHIEDMQPCFLLTRLEKTSAHEAFVILVFIPTGCPIRPRTIFASSRVPVQRYISRIYTGITDYFFDEKKECTYEQFVHINKKDESALSFEEILQKKEQAAQTVGQVALPTAESFEWDLDEDLKEMVKKLVAKEGPKVVSAIGSPKGEGVKLGETGDSLDDIPKSLPRYVAVHYTNKGEDKYFFIYYCPDTAPPREKMMTSTCKASFLKGCKDLGLEFEKNFDIRDEDEFNDEHLENLIHPPDINHGYGEIQIITKPKRPGRR